MPRSKEDNQKIREERMSMIKEAAVRVYASKGYLGTQMDDIAKEAGLAKGLLYYYFKSKPELFRFIFNDLMDRAFQGSASIVRDEKSLKESLESFIRLFIAASFERPVYPLVYKMMPEDLGHVFPDNAAEMQHKFFEQFSMPMVELFSTGMDQGEIPKGNPTLQALLFTNAVLSISHLLATNPVIGGGKSVEQVVMEIKRCLFYGIFNKESGAD